VQIKKRNDRKKLKSVFEVVPDLKNGECITALILFAGIYYGVAYGGTITPVPINVPGESSTVMTCIDGDQRALKGRPHVKVDMASNP